ncbi:MAG: hypothetical protein KKG59_03455 [Nanoarchaeota archaeon]|nr:hypothetical protein [Nanoarchaeota archaeon]
MLKYSSIDQIIVHLNDELADYRRDKGMPPFEVRADEKPLYSQVRTAFNLNGRKNLIRKLVTEAHTQISHKHDQRRKYSDYNPTLLNDTLETLQEVANFVPTRNLGRDETVLRKQLLELLIEREGLNKRKGATPTGTSKGGRKLEVEHALGLLAAAGIVRQQYNIDKYNPILGITAEAATILHDAGEGKNAIAVPDDIAIDHLGFDRNHPAYYFLRAMMDLRHQLVQNSVPTERAIMLKVQAILAADAILTRPPGIPWDSYTPRFFDQDVLVDTLMYLSPLISEDLGKGRQQHPSKRQITNTQNIVLLDKVLDGGSSAIDFPDILLQGEGAFSPQERAEMLYKQTYFANELVVANRLGLIRDRRFYTKTIMPVRRAALYFTIEERENNNNYMLQAGSDEQFHFPRDYFETLVPHLKMAYITGIMDEAREPETDTVLLRREPWRRFNGIIYGMLRGVREKKGFTEPDPRGIHEVPKFPIGRPVKLLEEGIIAELLAMDLYMNDEREIGGYSLLE